MGGVSGVKPSFFQAAAFVSLEPSLTSLSLLPCPYLQVITNWVAICGLVGKVVSAWRRRKEQPEKSENC